MTDYTREITKEEYDKVVATNQSGYIWGFEKDFFSEGALMGYGVYGAHVTRKDGKYLLKYSMGDSCD